MVCTQHGRTEKKDNNHNPNFTKAIEMVSVCSGVTHSPSISLHNPLHKHSYYGLRLSSSNFMVMIIIIMVYSLFHGKYLLSERNKEERNC